MVQTHQAVLEKLASFRKINLDGTGIAIVLLREPMARHRTNWALVLMVQTHRAVLEKLASFRKISLDGTGIAIALNQVLMARHRTN
jgi:hypothetical protein